jgi:hypothetical protein
LDLPTQFALRGLCIWLLSLLMATNHRTEAESQQIVGQAYSRAYNTPFISKSSTEDLSLSVPERVISCGAGPKPIATREHRGRWISSLSSMDSDLEAFSHNPADGSFAALAVQPTA